MTSWKGEVIADSTNSWVSNACRFATEREAALYVNDLARRWMLVRQVRVTESSDPACCRFDDGKVVWLTFEEEKALKAAGPALAKLLREQGTKP